MMVRFRDATVREGHRLIRGAVDGAEGDDPSQGVHLHPDTGDPG